MSTPHYFSSEPQATVKTRQLRVTLGSHHVTVSTAGGIFSPDGLDKGTAVLLKHVPAPAASGHLLDIGCGWGPIALSMAMASPEATVWAVDVNPTARMLCAKNAASLGLENVNALAPEEVPENIRFSTIWSNPPIRVGKKVLHEILTTWLPRLDSGASAWLVVQKNLGADSLQRWLEGALNNQEHDYSVDRPETDKGFRLLRVSQG